MIAIDHKTVSRQHFTITVEPVKDGDVANIFARTKIRVEDHSKTGTFINGDALKKNDPKNESEPNPSRELKDAVNSVRPGTCPWEFTVTWHPCVFTFNLLKKDIKSGQLEQRQKRVQSYDIKAIIDFSSEHTTHVVAAKRNTPKGLQALINGKHLVTDAYIDALDYAATPTTLSQDVNLSPLENDFESAWPSPEKFLPPSGKEPSLKPPEAYQPDPARVNVFEHYTFVFCDRTQYDNLMPVITTGHGKALLFKIVSAETTGDDLIRFLQNAAGHKQGGLQNGLSEDGVILVRASLKDDALQSWTNTITDEAVLKTDQRAIDQSEFLEAILSNDASLLQQPVPFESAYDRIVAPPSSVADQIVSQPAIPARSNGFAPVRTSGSRGSRQVDAIPVIQPPTATTQASQISAKSLSEIKPAAEGSAPKLFSVPKVSQAMNFKNFDNASDSDAVIEEDDDEDDVEEGSSSQAQAQAGTSRTFPSVKQEPMSTSKKRARSPSEDPADTFADEMDDLLPAATALKRRKLAEAAASGQAVVDKREERSVPSREVKQEKVIDVQKAVKKRQEEQEAARQDEPDLDPLNMEDKTPTYLAEVVAMDLPLRERMNGRANGEHGPEWDPKWNGRRNFKLFRRKGEPAQWRDHANKVIVPLELVPDKTGGFGDQYYSKTQEERELEKERKRKAQARSHRAAQTQTQIPRSSGNSGRRSKARVIFDDDDDNDPFGDEVGGEEPRSGTQTSPALSRLQCEAAEIADHEVDMDSPRQTRAGDRTQNMDGSDTERGDATGRRTQTQTEKGKRPATSTAETSKPKRQKTLPVTAVRDENSDDDDDTKFRFGSRARRGRGRGGRA